MGSLKSPPVAGLALSSARVDGHSRGKWQDEDPQV